MARAGRGGSQARGSHGKRVAHGSSSDNDGHLQAGVLKADFPTCLLIRSSFFRGHQYGTFRRFSAFATGAEVAAAAAIAATVLLLLLLLLPLLLLRIIISHCYHYYYCSALLSLLVIAIITITVTTSAATATRYGQPQANLGNGPNASAPRFRCFGFRITLRPDVSQVRPVHLLGVFLLRVLESNFPGDSL